MDYSFIVFLRSVLIIKRSNMEDLLLTTSGEWGEMLFTVFGLFGFLIIVGFIYGHITDKAKVDNDKAGCLWPIVIAISIAILFGIINCKGCKGIGGKGSGGDYWDNYPRHTQLEISDTINVNTVILAV
jgi:hypothetical protein